MTHPSTTTNEHPDARIDHVLNALRATQAPAGLEARIASRIAHANEAQTSSNSFFAAAPACATTSPFAATARHTTPSPFAAPARRATTSLFAVILNAVKDPRIFFADAMPYALPATALILLLANVSITFLTHQPPHTAALSKQIPSQPYAPAQPAPWTAPSSQASIDPPQAPVQANTQVPQGFSRGPHNPPENSVPSTPPPTDPDAIALAETLAPSRPAPPSPLTQQELLLLAVLRSGNQEGIAALNPAKRDALLAQNELAFNKFFAPPPPPPPTPTTGAKE